VLKRERLTQETDEADPGPMSILARDKYRLEFDILDSSRERRVAACLSKKSRRYPSVVTTACSERRRRCSHRVVPHMSCGRWMTAHRSTNEKVSNEMRSDSKDRALSMILASVAASPSAGQDQTRGIDAVELAGPRYSLEPIQPRRHSNASD
jgi:hypothetical protein